MTYSVTQFLRSSTETISARARGIHHKQTLVTPTRDRQASYASSNASTDSVVMSSAAASRSSSPSADDRFRNTSPAPAKSASSKKHLLGFHFPRSSRNSLDNIAATLDWNIESPPAVLYDSPENSSGALVSGLLHLNIRETQLEVDSFEAYFNLTIAQKKPYHNHCTDCASTTTELKRWTFFNEPKTLSQGVHEFPFSILIDGGLPASTNAPLVQISYSFKAVANVSRTQASAAISTSPVKFERTLEVKRSLIRPDLPHRSQRVFPPTDIKTEANYCQYIYPTATNTLSLRMDGVTVRNEAAQTVEYWKLRRVTWRLEENIKTTAHACDKHVPASANGDSSKACIVRTDTRVLGNKSLTDGWKADYTTENGRVDLEFEYGALHGKHHAHGPVRYASDVKAEGIEITHCLMVEMVVSREWAPTNRPELITHTGTGRILRMRYPVFLTESPGMGISWDNEAPPMYQDVPASPPSYPKTSILPLISYTELEELENSGSDTCGSCSESGVSSNSSRASSIDSSSYELFLA